MANSLRVITIVALGTCFFACAQTHPRTKIIHFLHNGEANTGLKALVTVVFLRDAGELRDLEKVLANGSIAWFDNSFKEKMPDVANLKEHYTQFDEVYPYEERVLTLKWPGKEKKWLAVIVECGKDKDKGERSAFILGGEEGRRTVHGRLIGTIPNRSTKRTEYFLIERGWITPMGKAEYVKKLRRYETERQDKIWRRETSN